MQRSPQLSLVTDLARMLEIVVHCQRCYKQRWHLLNTCLCNYHDRKVSIKNYCPPPDYINDPYLSTPPSHKRSPTPLLPSSPAQLKTSQFLRHRPTFHRQSVSKQSATIGGKLRQSSTTFSRREKGVLVAHPYFFRLVFTNI